MFIKRVVEAYKRAKEERAVARVSKHVLDDPLSIELIEKIAKQYDYHFEIVKTDGTVFRFWKRGAREPKVESEVW